MTKPQVKNAAVVFRPNLQERFVLLQELSKAFEHVTFWVEDDEHQDLRNVQVADRSRWVSEVDLVLCLGGDGTLIHACAAFVDRMVPILGVHLGRLGFLTEGSKSTLIDDVRAAVNHRLPHIDRMRLDVELDLRGTRKFWSRLLNELSVRPLADARLATFTLYVDGKLMTSLRADGVLITTPTGSTAYNLAAGGPILLPGLQAIGITPICPHQLTQRPVILPDDVEIQLRVDGDLAVLASCDGGEGLEIRPGDGLVIRKAEVPSRILSVPTRDYFQTLRSKLGWGEDPSASS